MPIRSDGRFFIDDEGRRLILHGVNLSGGSKIPACPPGPTHLPESLREKRDVSFVGRPFPLEEADEHFGRLRHWGLDFLRLVVTWEALEHEAPGRYDEPYLDYLAALIKKARQHSISLFIDPHQDVWSRFSGGDGAPAWTFDLVGLDIDSFDATGAAMLHPHLAGDFPQLIWASNYNRFAALTMFTLFFGGNRYAPGRQIDGRSVQDFLQGHYIAAFRHLAQRIADLPNVIGFGTMNEPHPGLIGVPDLRATDHILAKLEITPSPAEAIFLANGFEQECLDFGLPLVTQLPGRSGLATIDPQGRRAWKDGCEDIWREVGVWDLDDCGQPRLLRPAHFSRVDFAQDFLKPFTQRYAAAIREVMPAAHIFIEAEPLAPPPHYDAGDRGLVYAPHFYDPLTLLSKRFHPYAHLDLLGMRPLLGKRAIADYFRQRFGRFRQYADERMGAVPIVVGEFGIPFDFSQGRAYRSGDFSRQAQALDAHFQALDSHLLSYTQWNYTPDNSNQRGDLWNGEDFSIFSRDQQSDPADIDSGGRALAAVVRPYARKVAGEPLNMRFDRARGLFTFSFRHDSRVNAPTELFVPNAQFPQGYRVEVSDGEFEVDRERQRLLYRHGGQGRPHMIRVISNAPPPRELTPHDKLALLGVLAAMLLWLLGKARRGNRR